MIRNYYSSLRRKISSFIIGCYKKYRKALRYTLLYFFNAIAWFHVNHENSINNDFTIILRPLNINATIKNHTNIFFNEGYKKFALVESQ